MRLVCSYCRKELGDKEPYDNTKITHGMCIDCHSMMMRQLEGMSFDEYLEGFQVPVLIVNDQGRIAAANDLALGMMETPLQKVQGFLGGEALECVYARLPEGCGKTVHCPACTIRNLVETTRNGREICHRKLVFLQKEQERLQMEVTTEYVNGMVRIAIHEVQSVERCHQL